MNIYGFQIRSAVLVVFFIIGLTAVGFSQTVDTLEAAKDTHIRTDLDARANDNYGCDWVLSVGGSRGGGGIPYGGADGIRTMIKFDLSGITQPVDNAMLELTLHSFFSFSPPQVYQIDVHRIVDSGALTPWEEGNGTTYTPAPTGCEWVDDAFGVAWIGAGDGGDANNHTRPDYDPAVSAGLTIDESDGDLSGHKYHWDITALVNDWISGVYPNYGIILRDPTTDGTFKHIFFGTREAKTLYGSEPDAQDGPRLILTNPALAGTISGSVSAGGNELAGVTATLLDTAGSPVPGVDSDTTDSNGMYTFSNVAAPDSYEVVIVVPLGYDIDPEDNPQGTFLEAGGSNTVDFELTEVVITNEARGPRFWQHVINGLLAGQSCQVSEAEFLSYVDEVHDHYTPHYDVFSGLYTLEDWAAIFNKPAFTTDFEKARGQVAALVLNMVSLRIGQYTVVTDDNRTCGDVLTYTSDLLTDGDNNTDIEARFYASRVNRHILIGAGEIPAGSILYKGRGAIDWGFAGNPGEASSTPDHFTLEQNYPNPFNPSTTIRYGLSEDVHVSIDIYNVLGQRIRTLVNTVQQAGYKTVVWDGKDNSGRQMSGGVYIYRMKAGDYIKVNKMVLTK